MDATTIMHALGECCTKELYILADSVGCLTNTAHMSRDKLIQTIRYELRWSGREGRSPMSTQTQDNLCLNNTIRHAVIVAMGLGPLREQLLSSTKSHGVTKRRNVEKANAFWKK